MNSIQIATLRIESKSHNLVNDSRHNSQAIDRSVTIILIRLIETPTSVNGYSIRIPDILPIFSSFIVDLACSCKLSKSGSKFMRISHPCNRFFLSMNLYGDKKLSNNSFIPVTSELSELKQADVLKFCLFCPNDIVITWPLDQFPHFIASKIIQLFMHSMH
jgi:hypothetical protein